MEFGIAVAQRVVFFPTYICVDNFWSMAAGREVYGFPKSIGPVALPGVGEAPVRLSAATLVIETYSQNAKANLKPVMQIDRTAEGTMTGAVWGDIEQAFKALVHAWTDGADSIIVPGWNLLVDIFKILTHKEVPTVFLKQFRDAANGTRACYQAVIEAPCVTTALHGAGPLPGTFQATVVNFDTHPIQSDLGLAGPVVAADFAFWADLDFTAEMGTEIWKAP